MRRKPWARPELAVTPFFIPDPISLVGSWSSRFPHSSNPLWVEIGCGKGVSTARLAASTPEINLLALDIKSEVLAVAKRNADKEFALANRPVDNLLLTAQNVEQISLILSPADKVQRLLINFCNPWPKTRSHKHRLTHTAQLERYKDFLAPNALIVFKTDDDGLFNDSKEYLLQSGFSLQEVLWELPPDHPEARFASEHELLFREKGLPIHYIAATC